MIRDQPNQDRVLGNIYKARVEKVLPGMQAAFVNIGREKNAFLYRDDVLKYYLSEEEAEKKKNKSISHYVHQGEELIVQVTKEEIGTKGCRVTNVVTVPGHHLVYLPHSQYIAISKRFQTSESREAWRVAAEKWTDESEGLILPDSCRKRKRRDDSSGIKRLKAKLAGVNRRSQRQTCSFYYYASTGLY